MHSNPRKAFFFFHHEYLFKLEGEQIGKQKQNQDWIRAVEKLILQPAKREKKFR